ncbi:hypothetical protein ACFLS4_03760 [Bacteroidota bacterium]
MKNLLIINKSKLEDKNMPNTFKLSIAFLMIIILIIGCEKESIDADSNDIQTIWEKIYRGNQNVLASDMLITDDEGYFIVGRLIHQFEPYLDGDAFLIKTDASGEVLWEKTYGNEHPGGASSIVYANDGNLIIGGTTQSSDTGTDAYVIKVTTDGDEIWSKTFGDTLDEFVSVQKSFDGGYFLYGNIVNPDDIIVSNPGVAGYGGFAGRSNPFLLKTDENGNELWSHVFQSSENIVVSSGLPTPDGGLLFLASILNYPADDNDLYLLKVDGYGNEVWSQTLTQGSMSGFNMIQTQDGYYLISGLYKDTDNNQTIGDFLFLKIDQNGNKIWSSTFGDPDMIDYGKVLVESNSGGYVVVGEKTRNFYGNEIQMNIVKIDANGQLLGEESYASSHTMFSKILQHSNGEYIICASIYIDPVFNVILYKKEIDGKIEN